MSRAQKREESTELRRIAGGASAKGGRARTRLMSQSKGQLTAKRMQELDKANAIMRQAIEGVAGLSDLPQFLRTMLLSITQSISAWGGGVLLLEGNELVMPALVEAQRLVTEAEIKAAGVYRTRMTPKLWEFMQRLKNSREIRVMGPEDPIYPDAFRELHLRNGHTHVLHIPLGRGESLLGIVGIAFKSESDYVVLDESLLHLLVEQMTTAVELTRVAKMEREADELIERERAAAERVQELAAMNEVLEQSLIAASSSRDFTTTLSHIFLEIVRAAGAAMSHFFAYDAGTNTLGTEFWVRDGVLHHGYEPGAPPLMQGRFDADVTPAFQASVEKRDLFFVRYANVTEAEKALHWPGVMEWHMAEGMKVSCAIPLLAGDKPLGAVGLAWREDFEISAKRIQFLKSLASQAALVKELRKLASAEKAAAISREAETAAERRAEFLAQSNRVLQNTLGSLSEQVEMRGFLGRVLAEIQAYLNVPSVMLWEYDETGEMSWLYAVRRGEATLFAEELEKGERDLRVAVRDIVPGWNGRQGDPAQVLPRFIPDLEWDDTLMPGYRARLLEHGLKGIVILPLMLGDRAVGIISARLTDRRQFRPEQLENAQVLAHLATLAMRMTKLAEEAKKAAVYQEQRRAAHEYATHLERKNEELRRRDALLSCVAEITRRLLDAGNVEDALDAVLEILGKASRMSRTMILKEEVAADGSRCHSLWREWCEEGLPSLASLQIEQMPNSLTPEMMACLHAGESYWNYIEDVEQGLRPLFGRLQIKSTGCVPIFIAGIYFGTVAFDDCRERRAWSDAELDALKIVAQAIGAVLERLRSAERNARDKERDAKLRVAKLAETNQLLRMTLDVLAREDRVDQSLGHVLRIMSEHLGSDSSALWLYDENKDAFHVHLVYLRGKIIHAVPAEQEELSSDWPPSRDLYWKAHIQARRPLIYDVATYSSMTPAQREFLGERGVKTLLGVPLLLGQQIFGSFTVRFSERKLFTDDELELVQLLAHQATLACQLTNLATASQEAAVLEERGRIAGEIHDSLAQAFTGVAMQLEAAACWRNGSEAKYWEHISMAKDLACFGLAEARTSVLTLRPRVLEHGDFATALRHLARRTQITGKLDCTFAERGRAYELPPDIKYGAFRLVQEALNNALKHAQPKTISILLHYKRREIEIAVQDDGLGFDQKLFKSDGGFGITGMKERCNKLNGIFRLTSRQGKGTKVKVVLPIGIRP